MPNVSEQKTVAYLGRDAELRGEGPLTLHLLDDV